MFNLLAPCHDVRAVHKFAIAGENTLIDGYMTEKIATVLLAKAVPIYIGAPQLPPPPLLPTPIYFIYRYILNEFC